MQLIHCIFSEWVAQLAIDASTAGDDQLVDDLLEMLRSIHDVC